MSYDFLLILPLPGLDPGLSVKTFRVEEEERATALLAGQELPQRRSRTLPEDLRQRLATSLRETNSAFEFEAITPARPGAGLPLPPEAARLLVAIGSVLELTDPRTGVQISLFERQISLTVPYHHDPPSSEEAFSAIWHYLALLRREGGFIIYDNQLERVLDLPEDRGLVLQEYGKGRAMLGRFIQEMSEDPESS